jgi:hypothetical protein
MSVRAKTGSDETGWLDGQVPSGVLEPALLAGGRPSDRGVLTAMPPAPAASDSAATPTVAQRCGWKRRVLVSGTLRPTAMTVRLLAVPEDRQPRQTAARSCRLIITQPPKRRFQRPAPTRGLENRESHSGSRPNSSSLAANLDGALASSQRVVNQSPGKARTGHESE